MCSSTQQYKCFNQLYFTKAIRWQNQSLVIWNSGCMIKLNNTFQINDSVLRVGDICDIGSCHISFRIHIFIGSNENENENKTYSEKKVRNYIAEKAQSWHSFTCSASWWILQENHECISLHTLSHLCVNGHLFQRQVVMVGKAGRGPWVRTA